METARYRLRFITGVTLSAANYGSATYGAGTYGQRASDRVDAYDFNAIPLPGGYPVYPSWQYAQNDEFPDFVAMIANRYELVCDLGSVAGAKLVLAPIQQAPSYLEFPLTVDSPATKGRVRRVWQTGDLMQPGVYRPAIVLTYLSGRRLTVPFADIHTLTIRDTGVTGSGPAIPPPLP